MESHSLAPEINDELWNGSLNHDRRPRKALKTVKPFLDAFSLYNEIENAMSRSNLARSSRLEANELGSFPVQTFATSLLASGHEMRSADQHGQVSLLRLQSIIVSFTRSGQ